MYADHTSIGFAAPTNYHLEIMINTELACVNSWLEANKLSLNVAKTEFMVIGSRQRLQTQAEVSIQAHVECKEIKRVESSKSLGLTIAETLSWSKHIDNFSKKISLAISALKRVRRFIVIHSATNIYQVLIEPHFMYYCSAWVSAKLQKLQNRAAKVITKTRYEASTNSLGTCLDGIGFRLDEQNKRQLS